MTQLAHAAWAGEVEVDFSTPLVPHVREPSPGTGRPGGVPFDDLYEVVQTDNPDLPRCVVGVDGSGDGWGELELSVMHSFMPRYKAESTCVGYERGQRLFFSAPTIRRLRSEGLFAPDAPTDAFRIATAAMLEQDLQATLSPAENHSAFYVDPGKLSPTAVKRILYGLAVGFAVEQAAGVYPYANPILQDHLPPAVRFAEKGAFATTRQQDELRKLLYQVPRYFIVMGKKWPSSGRMVTTPMREVYKAALLAGWSPGHLWILRVQIESGARLSEVVALTILDWLECSNFGARSNAINKGSRGQVWKELEFTPGCAADGVTLINDHRVSRAEVARYGRTLKVDDFRETYAQGRHDELRVPIVLTRLDAAYSRDSFYNHVFAPTMAPLGVRGHDTRHDFVSRNLDAIYGRFWRDEHLLKAACEKLIDYMAWSTRELMLFLYSKRHRQRRDALLAAGFHTVLLADEAAALSPGRTPLPAFCAPNPVDAEFDEWMAAA